MESLPELVSLGVEFSCQERNCEDCGRYFDCNLPKRERLFNRARLAAIKERIGAVRHKVVVASAKGGVGKSTVSANLAVALAHKGWQTAILDFDFYGPSIPKILGVEGQRLYLEREGIVPVQGPGGLKVLSVGLLLRRGEAVEWFHELKRNALEEFLARACFGALDYLVIDLPPGTGSEVFTALQCLPDLTGIVVVTIPSDLSEEVVSRGVAFYRKAGRPILGVVENMSGFACTRCGRVLGPFVPGGGDLLAREAGVPLLGRVPLDGRVAEASDAGQPFILAFPDSPVARAFFGIVERIVERVEALA